MKVGDLVHYSSRLLIVVAFEEDKKSLMYGWARCCEVGSNQMRLYHQKQLEIVKKQINEKSY